MPMLQITRMKLLGAALLSLAMFSICTANAKENSSMTPTSNSIHSSPGYTFQFSTPTTKNIQSTPVSSDSTITINSSTNVSVASNVTWEPVFQTNSSQQPTQVTTSPSSITEANDKTSSGKTESLPTNSVTAASDSAWMTADLTTSIITSEHSKGHQTTCNATGSPPTPVTGTNATVIKSDTISPHQKSTSTPSQGRSSSNDKQADTDQYSGIILPVVIALIVITLSVFILVALYRMCQRTAPERQENGTEQAPTDKEGVKLLSVKTTSPETGEHIFQGKNRTHQPDESSSHLGNKYQFAYQELPHHPLRAEGFSYFSNIYL
ncbi:endomucin isoform X2 [Dermochelys coriacea]|uniref:endomucin isoform X2 n=1 Tax=Dermochelys coriacea TaxID=27794 RepID=UPI001CA8F7F5|nr:endomucin isoform X2 [Dermochelys coriacea]